MIKCLINSFFIGFSRTIVQLLSEQKVKFSSFDILTDEQVRQGI